jgi:hypothetical protein
MCICVILTLLDTIWFNSMVRFACAKKNWPYLAAECWHDILLSPLGFTKLHHHFSRHFSLHLTSLKPISLRPENAPFYSPFRTFLRLSLSFELFCALHFLQLSFVYRSEFRVLPRNFVITKNLRLRKSWKLKKFQALGAQFLYTNIFSVSFPSFFKPWQTVVAFFENPKEKSAYFAKIWHQFISWSRMKMTVKIYSAPLAELFRYSPL